MRITETVRAIRPGIGCIVYLIENEDGVMIVDTGSNAASADRVVRYLTERLKRPLKDVTDIVLTHGHWDHAGGANRLRALTGARVSIHQNDVPMLTGKPIEERWFGRTLDGVEKRMKQAVFRLGYLGLGAWPGQIVPDRVFTGTVERLNEEWTVHSVPGHTPGCVALWSEKQRLLISGDTAVTVMGKVLPPLALLTEDEDRIKESWRRLEALGAPDWILPGHFTPIRYGRRLALPYSFQVVADAVQSANQGAQP